MSSSCLLSILVPAYAYRDGVARILQMLGDIPPDVEVIIFDDTPGFEIQEVVGAFQDKTAGIIYQHNTGKFGKPLGAAANWNALLDAANGTYQILMHHDEAPFDADFLKRLRVHLTSPEPADVYIFDLIMTDKMHLPLRNHVPKAFRNFALHKMPFYLFRRNVIGPTATLAFRGEKAPRFDPSLQWLIDVEFYTQLFSPKTRWVDASDVRISSMLGRDGSITLEIASRLGAIDAQERKDLLTRYPQAHIWLGSRRGMPLRALERVVWSTFRAVTRSMQWVRRQTGITA